MFVVIWKEAEKNCCRKRGRKSVKRSPEAWGGIPFVPRRWYSISGTHIFIITM